MKKPIAINSSRYPVMAHVYEASDEKVVAVVFHANQDVEKMKPRSYKIYNIGGRPYFHHTFRFYLDECVRV